MAYGLHEIQEEVFPAEQELSPAVLARNDLTIKNVRLWDHRPLLSTYRQLQQIRTYYDFVDVDNDRYVINGEYRQVMLSPRELQYKNLPSRIWINEHLTYTHGYGVAMGPVNRISAEGLPEFFIHNIPPVSTINLKVTRPEIYYGEIPNDYVFVRTKATEFDYPSGADNVRTTYAGGHGVPMSGTNRWLWWRPMAQQARPALIRSAWRRSWTPCTAALRSPPAGCIRRALTAVPGRPRRA